MVTIRGYSRHFGLWIAAFIAPALLALLAGSVPGAADRFGSARSPECGVRLVIRVNHLFRGQPLRMDDPTLATAAGDRISISRLAYLISNVALIRADGSRVLISPGAAFLNPAEGCARVTAAGVPVGDYSGLAFDIGLDAVTNHMNPSRFGPSHPLNPQVCRLHWSWTGGYVFLAVEGGYTRLDGKQRGYSYHLGNDDNRSQITVKGALHISGDTEASVDFDVSRLFAGISPSPVNGADSTHSAPGDALAARLKGNLAEAFALNSGRWIGRSAAPTSQTRRVIVVPPLKTHAYKFITPDGFPQPALPADNPLTNEGIALGRRLFTDARLSGNGRQSCAGCHRPEAAFADRGHALSVGIDGKPGTRRTMPLCNLAWSAPYTWDGRRVLLRDQAIAPILNEREMHSSLKQVTARLAADPRYPAMFSSAFGTGGITIERVGLALEQYLLTLISADSKFDRAAAGEAVFTDQEKRGLLLFVTEYDPARGRVGADCFHCHGGNLFSDYRFTNNGLDEKFSDRGRSLVTHRAADDGKFKTPSLRNVAITGPYMHDGRFKTLEEVLEHYTRGIHRTFSLDPNIAKHPDSGMELTAEDKAALVAFLKTLTDYQYTVRSSGK